MQGVVEAAAGALRDLSATGTTLDLDPGTLQRLQGMAEHGTPLQRRFMSAFLEQIGAGPPG